MLIGMRENPFGSEKLLCSYDDGNGPRYLYITIEPHSSETLGVTVYDDGKTVELTELIMGLSEIDPWMWVEYGDSFVYVSPTEGTYNAKPVLQFLEPEGFEVHHSGNIIEIKELAMS